jgi:nucleoside-diphosphate-sugar epimerase
VRKLVARGDTVRTLARGDYPWLEELGVEARRGDIGDADAVRAALAGCDVVFHVAAKAGVWGPPAAYRRANVDGQGVPNLVFTSSPSVTFGGTDQAGVDEREPYPSRYLAHYPATKAEAERLVLAANGDALATVALRPHLIWGPGDPHLVPRILERGRAGKLKLVGAGTNLVDSVYVDNAADAHLLAAGRLGPGSPVAGKAYFISNGEPIPMADLLNRILAAGGVPAVSKTVPPGVAYAAGWIMEGLWDLFDLAGEPIMTRFVARQLATHHWFDLTAARTELGYAPAVSLDEGMARLQASLQGAPA